VSSVYELTGAATEINWSPATETEEIIQNVRFILGAIAGSVPLARGVGISGDVVDAPMSKARALLMTSVFRGIRINEPRASVVEIYVDEVDGNDGRIRPRVKIRI
jgi:hypothetical protein